MDLYAKDYWMKRYGDKDNLPLYVKYTIPKGIWEISLLGSRICKELLGFLSENNQAGEALDYFL